MTATAHGWSPELPAEEYAPLRHASGCVAIVAGPEASVRPAAKADLAACIHDAALLAEARRLVPFIKYVARRNDTPCPVCIYRSGNHYPTCNLGRLLALLTEEDTDG